MVDLSPRIQRIAIWSWSYEFNTEWIRGKKNSVANALSRVSPARIENSDIAITIRAVKNTGIFQHTTKRQGAASASDQGRCRTPSIIQAHF